MTATRSDNDPEDPTLAAPVEFYFDFASPYGYLAATQIDGLASRHGRDVVWRPILLGAAFKVTGSRPNVAQPLRGDYLRHDVVRFARLLGIPLAFPPGMPITALAPSRAYWWLFDQDPDAAKRLARVLYDAHWGEGRDIADPEAVAGIAAAHGIDATAVRAGMQSPAVKQRLREETDAALARGVFGAPFIFVDGEAFWGADRLSQIDRWLAGGW